MKYTSLLALFSAGYVNPAFWEKAGRRSSGYAYVFCLASKENAGAKLVYFINPSFLSLIPHPKYFLNFGTLCGKR